MLPAVRETGSIVTRRGDGVQQSGDRLGLQPLGCFAGWSLADGCDNQAAESCAPLVEVELCGCCQKQLYAHRCASQHSEIAAVTH